MSKESKEVTTKKSTEVSTDFANMFDQSLVSSGDTMDSEDIRLPKLTLIQAMTKSTFNTEKAAAGNFVNSIEKNDLGSSLDVFIMSDVKLWQFDYETKKGKEVKKEYLTITDFAPYSEVRKNWGKGNYLPAEVIAKAEAKGINEDQLLMPDLIYRFYVLLVDEVKEGVAFPYIVDFKRSSATEGNKLKNIFFKMRKMMKLPSYAKVFNLSSEFVQDEYDYYIKKCTGGRNITKEELVAVETWAKELQSNSTKYSVDESEEEESFNNEEVVEAEVSAKF